MKIALVIGYGSIGKRHVKILTKFKKFKKIVVFTKQKIKNYNTISNLAEIRKLNPSYIVISTRTNEHFKYLAYCEKYFSGKTILVEKPVFEKIRQMSIRKNKVYVGYNLRFHPVIQKIKQVIKKKEIFNINIQNSSFLPNWRSNIHYTKSNSAKKLYGGGILLELSHELDFIRYLFGDYTINFSINKKVSNLKINTDDILVLSGFIRNNKKNKTILNLNQNFFSKIIRRDIFIDGKNFYMHADLINSEIKILRNQNTQTFSNKKNSSAILDDTYYDLHKAVLRNDEKIVCTYKQALVVMRDIELIRRK